MTGSRCLSLHTCTLGLSCVWLAQICTLLAFSITTIPAHHSVGTLTSAMTPTCLILATSSFTCFMRAIAILRRTVRARGFAPSWNLMEYSPSSFPRPQNRVRNCSIRFFVSLSWTAPTCTTKLSALIASRPSVNFHNFSTMYTCCSTSLFSLQNLHVNWLSTGRTWFQGPRRNLLRWAMQRSANVDQQTDKRCPHLTHL